MSKALELAEEWFALTEEEKIRCSLLYADEMEAELRRVAEIERKYNEIMAQEPVGWAAIFADDIEVCEMFTDESSADDWIDSDNCLWHVEKKPLYTLKKD